MIKTMYLLALPCWGNQKVSHLHTENGLSHLHDPLGIARTDGHCHNQPILMVLPSGLVGLGEIICLLPANHYCSQWNINAMVESTC